MSTSAPRVLHAEHHPAIRDRQPVATAPLEGFDIDFLGTRTKRLYYEGMLRDLGAKTDGPSGPPSLPAVDEEYFEWVDILESVDEATDRFVMVELGAGYGRWCMRAASAARARGLAQVQFVAVEAEPDHFRWMLEHFRENGIDPRDHELFWAVVSRRPGLVPFWIGKASSWYGQAVAHKSEQAVPGPRERRRLKARAILGRPPAMPTVDRAAVWVPSVTLTEILEPYPHVDLLDIDVQGAEYEVLASAIDSLTRRVRRIHIGTHSTQIEHDLRTLFESRRWEKVNDYPCQGRVQTPFGEVQFGDGVQTWLNPRLRSAAGSEGLSTRVEKVEKTGVADTRKTRRLLVSARTRARELKAQNRVLKAEVGALRRRCRDAEKRLDPVDQSGWTWANVKRRMSGWLRAR